MKLKKALAVLAVCGMTMVGTVPFTQHVRAAVSEDDWADAWEKAAEDAAKKDMGDAVKSENDKIADLEKNHGDAWEKAAAEDAAKKDMEDAVKSENDKIIDFEKNHGDAWEKAANEYNGSISNVPDNAPTTEALPEFTGIVPTGEKCEKKETTAEVKDEKKETAAEVKDEKKETAAEVKAEKKETAKTANKVEAAKESSKKNSSTSPKTGDPTAVAMAASLLGMIGSAGVAVLKKFK